MELIKGANLALRFLLELCALAALAYWGYHATANRATNIALAIAAPLVAAVVWALFVSPNASVKVPSAVWVLLQVLVFGAAAVGLVLAGRQRLPVIFVVLVVANALLMAVWKQ
jgi:hypothetical protein